MMLRGSCHCGAVRFALRSHTPYPYMLCYCSICRKTAGGGGYAITIMGDAATLEIEGEAEISIYRARLDGAGEGDEAEGESALSPCRRHFCRHCGSALWVSDPRWPELVHPFASAIDTALPKPPERVVIMLDYAVPWVEPSDKASDRRFAEYPDQSIEDWHRGRGLYQDD